MDRRSAAPRVGALNSVSSHLLLWIGAALLHLESAHDGAVFGGFESEQVGREFDERVARHVVPGERQAPLQSTRAALRAPSLGAQPPDGRCRHKAVFGDLVLHHRPLPGGDDLVQAAVATPAGGRSARRSSGRRGSRKAHHDEAPLLLGGLPHSQAERAHAGRHRLKLLRGAAVQDIGLRLYTTE